MTRHWQQLLTEASEAFNPAEVKVFDTLTVPERLTAVEHIPNAIQNKLASLAYTLHKQDPSLLLVKPENYHITIASAPIETGVDQFKAITEEALRKQQIELDLSGLLLDSEVIAAVAYPKEQELHAVRKQIASALGESSPESPRSELGWSSIARFTQPPSREMVSLALREIRKEWGHFTIDSVAIYKTTNKHLDGAEEVATIVKTDKPAR